MISFILYSLESASQPAASLGALSSCLLGDPASLHHEGDLLVQLPPFLADVGGLLSRVSHHPGSRRKNMKKQRRNETGKKGDDSKEAKA